MGHARGREATDGDCAIKFESNENDFALRVAIAFRSCGLATIASSSILCLLSNAALRFSPCVFVSITFKGLSFQTLLCPCCLVF